MNTDSRSGGFTLLEVMLTLALSSLVVVALAMAIDFQLRVVELGRTDVEEAQLARVILHHIANDIAGAVTSNPMETESLLSKMISSETLARSFEEASEGSEEDDEGEAASGGDPSASSGGQGGGTSGATSQAEGTSTGEGADELGYLTDEGSDDLDESLLTQSALGLYGGIDWLQVDVSRLPRLDQFEQEFSSSDIYSTVDLVSDVKTVSYFFVTPDEAGASYSADDPEYTGGLYRTEVDRASASWAGSGGPLDDTGTEERPIAPEVTAVEFLYCDGTDWLEEWDSEEQGGLPQAVKITLTIIPYGATDEQLSELGTGDLFYEDDPSLKYSLVVRLPAAEIAPGGGDSGDFETSESDETGETSGDSESGPAESEPDSGGGSR